MQKTNSCINSKAVIDFVAERDPAMLEPLLHNLSPELDGVADPYAFLCDPNNWISSQTLINLYERVKRLFDNEDVVFDIGFESVAKHRLGYIQRVLFFAFRNHGRTLKRLQALNDKFNRNKKVELVDLRDDGAMVRLHWFDRIPMTRDFCLMNKGVYSAVPMVWGDPPCQLIETACFFQGDGHCEYQISWKRRLSLGRLLRAIVAPWRLADATIQELERDKELLREKYAEVHALNQELRSQVARLLSLQEAGNAILSTLDIEEVMNLILKGLVDVSSLDRAAIFLLDRDRGVLALAHAVGAEPEELETAKNYSVPIDKESNIIARVARSGEAEMVTEVTSGAVNLENPLIRQFKPKAFIALPLKVRGEVVGVLVGDQRQGGGESLAREKDFLVSFSHQIAIAIHNANLYRKLEDSERQYRELVENAHEGIWVVDDHGEITFANRRLAAILGYDEVRGRNLADIVTQEKRHVMLKLLLENLDGAVAQEELELVRADGQVVAAIVSSVPIVEDRQYRGSFAMVTDITDKKRMEAQLLHRQKMESVGTMAGGIAHDFNNILTGILGYASLLKYRLRDDPETMRFVDIIERSSLRAADLIRQLLAFSRGTQAEGKQVVAVNKVIAETSRLLESSLGKHVDLRLQLEKDLPGILANPTQVQQAVLNLCLNARDAMPRGGTLTISTDLVEVDRENASLYPELAGERGRYVRISVRDTGIGIPAEHLDKIFDPFFTTKEVGKGTGLGLAMVYGIVKNSAGHIRVSSREGQGSQFELFFPAAASRGAAEAAREAKVDLQGGESILLVDDEELVRELGVQILTDYGYKVETAKDGLEALKMMEASEHAFDLVILDLMMPNLNGMDTCNRLKKIAPDLKVIICTGHSRRKEDLERLTAAGTAVVTKPFRPPELAAVVRRVLDGQESTAGMWTPEISA